MCVNGLARCLCSDVSNEEKGNCREALNDCENMIFRELLFKLITREKTF